MYHYQATLLRVIDADTVQIKIDLGFDIDGINLTVRLAGIDAPEKSTEAGKKALRWLKRQIGSGGKTLWITTKKDRKEKFGRYLATIWLSEDSSDPSKSINQMMITKGHAKPYDGRGPRT